MNKLLLVCLLLFAGMEAYGDTLQKQHHVVISSGSDGSPYNLTAEQIAHIINGLDKGVYVTHVNSGGSYDNFNRMRQGVADMIIAQRDVAVEKYYYNDLKYRDFEIMIPLFPEMLQIYVKSDSQVVSSNYLNHLISKKNGPFVISVGRAGSSTSKTTRILLSLLFPGVDNIQYDESTVESGLRRFLHSDSVDAFAFFSAPPYAKINPTEVDSMGIFSLRSVEVQRLNEHLPNLQPVSIPSSRFSFIDSEGTINGLGTWAFLISKSEVSRQLRKRRINLTTLLIDSFRAKDSIAGMLNYVGPNYTGKPLAYDDTKELLDIPGNSNLFFFSLPLTKETKRIIHQPGWWIPRLFFGLLLLLAVGGLVYLYRYIPNYQVRIFMRQYSHIVLHIFIFLGGLLIAAIIVHVSENRLLQTTNLRSPFVDFKLRDTIRWLLLMAFLDYDSNAFPISTPGQVITTVSRYILPLMGVTAVGSQLLFNYNYNLRKMGSKIIKRKGHIVIIGYNEYLEDILATYLQVFDEQQDAKKYILCINENYKSVDELRDRIRYEHLRKQIDYYKGSIEKHEVLVESQIHEADTVILLCESKEQSADRDTLLRALAVSDFCQEQNESVEDHIYMIAEINEKRYEDSLNRAGVNEIICTTDMGNKLLVQSSLNQGMANGIGSLMTYDDRNEFYTIAVADYPEMLNRKTYDDLLIFLRKMRIQLFMIKIVFKTGNGVGDKDIIDKYKIELCLTDIKRAKKEVQNDSVDKLSEAFILNPTKDNECNYKTDEWDKLVLLAPSKKYILNQLNSWSRKP